MPATARATAVGLPQAPPGRAFIQIDSSFTPALVDSTHTKEIHFNAQAGECGARRRQAGAEGRGHNAGNHCQMGGHIQGWVRVVVRDGVVVCVRLNAANGSFSALLEFKRPKRIAGVRAAVGVGAGGVGG